MVELISFSFCVCFFNLAWIVLRAMLSLAVDPDRVIKGKLVLGDGAENVQVKMIPLPLLLPRPLHPSRGVLGTCPGARPGEGVHRPMCAKLGSSRKGCLSTHHFWTPLNWCRKVPLLGTPWFYWQTSMLMWATTARPGRVWLGKR